MDLLDVESYTTSLDRRIYHAEPPIILVMDSEYSDESDSMSDDSEAENDGPLRSDIVLFGPQVDVDESLKTHRLERGSVVRSEAVTEETYNDETTASCVLTRLARKRTRSTLALQGLFNPVNVVMLDNESSFFPSEFLTNHQLLSELFQVKNTELVILMVTKGNLYRPRPI